MSTSLFFFFNDTATTEIYTLSLHDALPIFIDELSTALRLPKRQRGETAIPNLSGGWSDTEGVHFRLEHRGEHLLVYLLEDRKSTRLNSSHSQISYAVFCLKKKNTLTRLARYPRSESLRFLAFDTLSQFALAGNIPQYCE